MTRNWKIAFAVALVLTLLAAVQIVLAAKVSARQIDVKGTNIGQVLIGGDAVISFEVGHDGRSPKERADKAADNLKAALKAKPKPKKFEVKSTDGGEGVYVEGQLIAVATSEDAKANDSTAKELANEWKDNIASTLRFDPDGNYYSDWEGAKTKWVPILDVGNQGVRIGAAQVAGPAIQVDKVKAVAQLELQFKGAARIKAYVPIDSYDVIKLNRIQGVSVWATGDLKIVRF
jgi:hypothetical protein